MTMTAPESSLDRQLVELHYWRFTPSGIVVPGFFDEIDWTDDEREDFWEAQRTAFAGRWFPEIVAFLYSYETEHRRNPIRTVKDAYEALGRISAGDYDTAPGMAIKAAREEVNRQIHEEQRDAVQTKMHGTFEFAREVELVGKNLPNDPLANLDLMRLVLGMPKKSRAET